MLVRLVTSRASHGTSASRARSRADRSATSIGGSEERSKVTQPGYEPTPTASALRAAFAAPGASGAGPLGLRCALPAPRPLGPLFPLHGLGPGLRRPAQPLGAGRRPAVSEQAADGLDRQRVAVAAEAGDRAGGHRGHDRRVAPRLPGVGVGDVELDHRPVEHGQGVVEPPGVMGERAGVDDDGGAATPGDLDGVDEVALGVGLEVLQVEPGGVGGLAHGGHVVVEGLAPVDPGLPLAQQVEVGPAENQDDRPPAAVAHVAHVDEPIRSSTARAVPGSTPVTTSTPCGPSRTNVSPSTAFLSRAINAISSAASTEAGRAVGSPYSPITRRWSPTRAPSIRPSSAASSSAATTLALMRTQAAMRATSGCASRSSPVRKWYLAISPSPDRRSRSGSVARESVSHRTADGCQNAPTRFLPSGRLTPVLPPMAASTMPRSVVGTCTTPTPRW